MSPGEIVGRLYCLLRLYLLVPIPLQQRLALRQDSPERALVALALRFEQPLLQFAVLIRVRGEILRFPVFVPV